jgi:hypothetical protein
MDEMFDEWLANQEKIKPSIKTDTLKAKIKTLWETRND